MLLTPVGKILVRLWSKLLSRLSGKLFITRQLGAGCMEVWDLRGYHIYLIPGSYFTRHMNHMIWYLVHLVYISHMTCPQQESEAQETGPDTQEGSGLGLPCVSFSQQVSLEIYLFYGMFNYFLSLEILIPMLLTCKIQLEWWDQPMWRRSSPPLPGTTAGMPQRIPPGPS